MAPVKDSNTPLPRIYVEEYWALVRKSLENIFSKSPNEADALQQTIENLPIAKQDFFYNTEPLHVAADLADAEPTDEQIEMYLWLSEIEDLKQILTDYDYLKYDATQSTDRLLQVNVTSLNAERNGGSYTEQGKLDETWSFFTLKKVDPDQRVEIQLFYEITDHPPSPIFKVEQIAA